MPETVRVRCAVGYDKNGEIAVYGVEGADESTVVEQIQHYDGVYEHFWVTVEIPLPVEPVVVAEVEGGDE